MKKTNGHSKPKRSPSSVRVQFSLDKQSILDLSDLAIRGNRPKSAEIRRLIAKEKSAIG